jgi:hypothetical protein
MSTRPTSKRSSGSPEAFILEYPYTTFDGEDRIAVVTVDAVKVTAVWSVYDIPAKRGGTVGWLVERLDAHDEKLDAAIGLARAYQESQGAFHSNERGSHSCPDPLPNPTVIPIKEIRKDAALARRVVAAMTEPEALAA